MLTYHAKSGEVAHTKSETNEVVDSLDIGSVEPGDEKTFEHFLSVPEVPTTVVDGDAVDIKYKLKVEVRLLNYLKNLHEFRLDLGFSQTREKLELIFMTSLSRLIQWWSHLSFEVFFHQLDT